MSMETRMSGRNGMGIPYVHRLYIRRERLTGAAVNLAFSLAFTALLFSGDRPIRLWGGNGMAVDFIPTVFMLTLLGNLAVTMLTIKRLRDGDIGPMPAHLCGWAARRLSNNILARVVLVAVVVTVAVVPCSILLLWLLGIESMTFPHYLVFKALYGPLVGALSTAVVIKAALRGPVPV